MAALIGLELLGHLGYAVIGTDATATLSLQHLESKRTIVEVTQDGDGYVPVDLTGCKNAQAIRERILIKFLIPYKLYSSFAIYPTEIGGIIIGGALSDDQLLLYHRFAEKVPLRFFLRRTRMPLSAFPDPLTRSPRPEPLSGASNYHDRPEVRKDGAKIKINTSEFPIAIHNGMPIDEVLGHLHDNGCSNLTSRVDKYEVSEYPVSTGGSGDVYLAKLRCGTRVGLKCIRPVIDPIVEGCKKLKHAAHELYVWSKCRHPNIQELIGITEHRGHIAMVSPWMENGDLNRFLSRKPRPQVNLCSLCTQIADGVAYLHRNDIVHGDLKGGNILISDDFTPKIVDFGSAGLKKYTLRFATTTTRPGLSVRWTAPEVINEETGNSAEADVYSLGMTILEVISGKHPYAHVGNEGAVIRRIITGALPDRPEEYIPSTSVQGNTLWGLLTRCWTYDPLGRPEATMMKRITPEGLR
ncbi:unnamed protein product [Rhizoctonia solani]|uniref:Protein kinase domain-containing protein n=1 Tax=Rhizoctonia solani TaxID=456999 RepID=A0A8H3GTW4_9AGAM|nr:unnamed protein product [Rhizoctonia solani]